MTIVHDSSQLHHAIFQNLNARMTHRGEVVLSCVPAALEHYVQQLQILFTTLGKPLTANELEQVRQLVAQGLQQGFQTSANARLVVRYEITISASLEKNLAFSAALALPSLAEQYKTWLESKQPSLFGHHPDAKVMAIVAELGDPKTVSILDVGAGTGRNAMPLARLGHPVDALELTPEFAEYLKTTATQEQLPITVMPGDLLDPLMRLQANHYSLAILSEVVSHFRDVRELRMMLAKVGDALRPGGLLLFNLFLAKTDYEPDRLAEEMSQVAWSCLFTRSQLTTALDQLPLTVLSEESALTYEQTHLPPEAFPPTPWFVAWATGKSVFPLSQGQPPMELCWVLCQRQGS